MRSTRPSLACCALLAFASLTLTAQSDRADRQAEIQKSRRDLLIYTKEDSQRASSPAYLPTKTKELRELIRKEVLYQLNQSQWTDSTLLPSLSPVLPQGPYSPVTFLHRQLSGTEYVLLGYSIAHGPSALTNSTAVIEAYRKGPDGFEPVDQTGEALANSLPKLQELPSPWTDQIWLLGHGQQTGVMQYHERACIYSFDGQRFQELWKHAPMRAPSYRVDRNELTIVFLDEYATRAMDLTLVLLPGGVREVITAERQ